MSLDDHRREPLLFGPSPVHPLPRWSEALGGRVEIWAEREDCNSGIAFGGNTVRKLENLAVLALDTGCDTLESIGVVCRCPAGIWPVEERHRQRRRSARGANRASRFVRRRRRVVR